VAATVYPDDRASPGYDRHSEPVSFFDVHAHFVYFVPNDS